MSEFPATNSPASVPLPAPPASHYLNPLHSHACANRAGNHNGIISLQKKVGGGAMFFDSQSGTMARGSGVFPPPPKPLSLSETAPEGLLLGEPRGSLANERRTIIRNLMAHSLLPRISVTSRSPGAAQGSGTLACVRDVVEQLALRDRSGEIITAVHHIPAREAQWAPMPEWVRPELAAAYREEGVTQLYRPQASASAAVHAGCNVVVVTPTASGKTLCYNLPVLNQVLENPDARALYLFPTKALAQDQLAELHDLGERLSSSFGVFTYDGDTPADARIAIRDRGHIVVTNPDMLHAGILPHHTLWTRLFENLQYIVLDELHTYRGVFGSHLANVLRRLRRVAAFYGS